MYLLPTHSLGCESYSRSRPSGWLNLKLEPGPCSERHQRAVALPAWDTQDEIGPWARQNRSSGWRGRQTQPSTQTCDHRPDGSAQAVHFHPPDGTSRVCCKTRASQALFPEGKTGAQRLLCHHTHSSLVGTWLRLGSVSQVVGPRTWLSLGSL